MQAPIDGRSFARLRQPGFGQLVDRSRNRWEVPRR
jgi:hypothetical protein